MHMYHSTFCAIFKIFSTRFRVQKETFISQC
uniref:Uncharacterized protein n=1 Tax=Anguilla anguilla TaxID=7936 RepID=A0A0E9SIV5_ANGAN